MTSCLFQPVKDESGMKYFHEIQEAMRVCDTLEARTFGRVIYRPSKDFLNNRFYLVRKERNGDMFRNMTVNEYKVYAEMYLD